MNKRFFLLLLLLFGWGFIHCAPADAHRVNVFAWVEGNTIYTTSKFSGGRVAQKSLIEVYDSRKNLLLSGHTDATGAFSFPIPKIDDLEIVLEAGTGHRGTWKINKNEIEAAQGDQPSEQKSPPSKPEQTRTTLTERSKPQDCLNVSGKSPETTAELEKFIEETISRTLDRKLHPLMVMIAETRNPKPGFREILGGLGYIFGLIGVAAYVHSRRKP
ncbi:MAG: hypothetical protein J7L57_04745 [Deltaproteobacteria bacterium]|nr:hypothetical protein [Candidatus Tharpella sp.]